MSEVENKKKITNIKSGPSSLLELVNFFIFSRVSNLHAKKMHHSVQSQHQNPHNPHQMHRNCELVFGCQVVVFFSIVVVVWYCYVAVVAFVTVSVSCLGHDSISIFLIGILSHVVASCWTLFKINTENYKRNSVY